MILIHDDPLNKTEIGAYTDIKQMNKKKKERKFVPFD